MIKENTRKYRISVQTGVPWNNFMCIFSRIRNHEAASHSIIWALIRLFTKKIHSGWQTSFRGEAWFNITGRTWPSQSPPRYLPTNATPFRAHSKLFGGRSISGRATATYHNVKYSSRERVEHRPKVLLNATSGKIELLWWYNWNSTARWLLRSSLRSQMEITH